ncbi:MAG: dihydrolipoamide acetyltransferase family protein [Paracoccaceae bacterium]
MTTHVFKLPDIGEGIAEVEILAWHVEVGDVIAEDAPLVDVQTDKAAVEISAPVGGIVLSRSGAVGSKVQVGAALATFDVATPEVPTVAKAAAAPAAAVAKPATTPASGTSALAAPAVRARAAAMGIGLDSVAGSGLDGRVLHGDLDRLLHNPQSQPVLTLPPGGEAVPVVGLRRRIAERMQDAHARIPHFTYIEEVDVTALEVQRHQLNAANPQRPHLTLLPFLILAVVKSIAAYPDVNALFDDKAGVMHRFAALHIGIATQTPRGLLVPVIRHAEALDLWQLAAEIARLTAAAQKAKSAVADLSGSTLTLTSLGALGGIAATPILNAPEVAVIGVNRITERPVVIDGAITIRKMMNLSSSFDHRIIDGHVAASFIQSVKKALETT